MYLMFRDINRQSFIYLFIYLLIYFFNGKVNRRVYSKSNFEGDNYRVFQVFHYVWMLVWETWRTPDIQVDLHGC